MSGEPTPQSCAGPGTATTGWRLPLGALWHELARSRAARSDPDEGARPRELLELGAAQLVALLEPGRPPGRGSYQRLLSCAAAALEGCARASVAYAGPPVLGRLQLLRQLEQRLEESELAALRGDGDYLVRREGITARAERVRLALHALARGAHAWPAAELDDALGALEDSSLGLAALAVRAALNVSDGGDPSGESDTPAALVDQLARQVASLADEAAAERARSRRARRPAGAAARLADALNAELPATARGARRPGSGPRARSPRLGELGAAWLRLGASQLLLVEVLDEAEAIPVFGDRGSIRETLAQRAALLVHRARLAARPHRFDHLGAWSRQREDLAAAAESHMREQRQGDACARVAELTVFSGLKRSAAALWAINAQLDPARP